MTSIMFDIGKGSDITLRQKARARRGFWEKTRAKVRHPVEGMMSKGFTVEETAHAVIHAEEMIEFYTNLLRTCGG